MKACRTPLAILLSTWLAAPGLPNQAAILQIRIVEGEGAVYGAGSRASRPLVVQVTDETGKPVEAAAVSFRLPDGGPSGVFPNGLRSELSLTSADGRASIRGMRWNRTAGPMEIRITASKGQARAGTVVAATLSDSGSGSRPGLKWALLGVAAGAAAGGFAYALSRNGASSTRGAEPPRIGVPVITVGAP